MPGLVQGMTISETRRMKQFFVYILASRSGGAIYVGVTNDLVRRVHGHKNGMAKGHTKNYRINKLVHFECYETARDAIQREKNIKHWSRAWKTRFIGKENPTWRDLYEDIAGK